MNHSKTNLNIPSERKIRPTIRIPNSLKSTAWLRLVIIFGAYLSALANFSVFSVWADEGMHPISQIDRLDLKAKGLQLSHSEIFSAEDVCLTDAIVRVNGCTGSFVSSNGLIITNHHCAYAAIQQASTPDQDFLAAGFIANQPAMEIPAKGYVVRVTETFEDVSDLMLSAVDDNMDSTARTKALERRRKELEQQAEAANPQMRAEVAEMFTGKTYVRFMYTYLRDVRLVFAPPKSIGKFGGDVDNWEWPRHTGDFAFMRAYVAADGTSADFSPDNVPYRPKRHLQVAAAGAQEGDFVMLLGYPGRTARHQTARYLQYLNEDYLPYIVELNQSLMEIMVSAGADDRSIALKNLSRIQSLSNVEKRSRGQLKGLANTPIIRDRVQAEKELIEYVNADPVRAGRYKNVIDEIAGVYQEMSAGHRAELDFQNLQQSLALKIAFTVYDAVQERTKPDIERESAFMDRNFDQTINRISIDQQNFNRVTDQAVLRLMLDRLASEAATNVADQTAATDLNGMYEKTQIADEAFVQSCLAMTPEQLAQIDDPFIVWMKELYPDFIRLRELGKQREGQLNRAYGPLISIKQEWLKTDFVPDANGTLRLTYGTVRGYSPADAVYLQPFTSVSGVLAKTTGVDPFITPQAVIDRFQNQEFGDFAFPDRQDVPVAMLYDTDTTGGNSGSPVINGRGELVGVNFDRAFEATINDFAWNTNYSRSIGVDVRYVLWLTGVVFEGQALLQEMGVTK